MGAMIDDICTVVIWLALTVAALDGLWMLVDALT